MAQNDRPAWKAIPIPPEAYGTLLDFCIEALHLEDVPEEEDLGLVAAYLLGLGMQALEKAEAPESALDGVAS